MKWIIIVLAALEAGYMLVDGIHAIATGSYIAPKTGPHAGKLGPWASIVSRAGIRPASAGMKWFFVGYGAAWLCGSAAFGFGAGGARTAMLVFAAGALWYAPVGTVLSLAQLALLWFVRS